VLAAACLALNQVGEGSSPSGPTDEMAMSSTTTVRQRQLDNDKHGSFSGKDSAPVMRKRGFDSHPVLSQF
jgi:hypothetical protein